MQLTQYFSSFNPFFNKIYLGRNLSVEKISSLCYLALRRNLQICEMTIYFPLRFWQVSDKNEIKGSFKIRNILGTKKFGSFILYLYTQYQVIVSQTYQNYQQQPQRSQNSDFQSHFSKEKTCRCLKWMVPKLFCQ